MFFRVTQDIAMQGRYSDAVVAELATLAEALQVRGTRLMLAPVPGKSLTMPHLLPQKAAELGFDFDTALAVYRDIHARLSSAGVTTVDLQPALASTDAATPPFFGADTHWNSVGAKRAAEAIAEVLRSDPRYGDMPQTRHQSVAKGTVAIPSGMRRIIQQHCKDKVPEAVTTQYETKRVQDVVADSIEIGLGEPPLDIGLDDAPLDIGLEEAPLDIGLGDAPLDIGLSSGPAARADAATALPVALVGTSFSDMAAVNFPGFLAQHSDLEVVNYAITGGGQFTAISSYLTSEDFQSAPPAFLVWELPIYLNIAQGSDQPMRELIAAARGNCRETLEVETTADGNSLKADLPAEFGAYTTLFVDTGSAAVREVAFRFTSATGRTRTKSILRSERARLNGRFYMPLSGLPSSSITSVEISSPSPFGDAPRLFACNSNQT